MKYKTRDWGGEEKKEEVKKCKSIPFTANVFYDVVKTEGLKKKLMEFITELNYLTEKELIYFDLTMKTLANTALYHSSDVTPECVKIIRKLLDLPIEKLFPALDLYRIFLNHPNSVEAYN